MLLQLLAQLSYLQQLHYCLNNFSVPNIGEVLESLIDAKRFSCYDCSSGFWGLRLRTEDRHFTAFHGYYKGAWNLFQWCRMPFGLKVATATYQRMHQRIMGPQPSGGARQLQECWISKDVCSNFEGTISVTFLSCVLDHILWIFLVLCSFGVLSFVPSRHRVDIDWFIFLRCLLILYYILFFGSQKRLRFHRVEMVMPGRGPISN